MCVSYILYIILFSHVKIKSTHAKFVGMNRNTTVFRIIVRAADIPIIQQIFITRRDATQPNMTSIDSLSAPPIMNTSRLYERIHPAYDYTNHDGGLRTIGFTLRLRPVEGTEAEKLQKEKNTSENAAIGFT